MRRYVFDKEVQQMPHRHYDVVIVGGGLAGLYTALQLKDNLSVVVLVKDGLDNNNSSLAQGGIAAVVNKEDDFSFHLEDTLKASAGIANPQLAKLMIKEGPEEIAKLETYGVVFDADADGTLHTTREGAHSHDRILHCGGDATGRLMMENLLRSVSEKDGIDILKNHCLVDIITDKSKRACGVVAFDGEYKAYLASRVVLCTGGIGGLYQYSTNKTSSTGDGIAAAVRAGALMNHMEFVQFHPTAFYNSGSGENFFLISEAVRGEGGILRNAKGEPFMQNQHPMKDLAPRDLVAREIFLEMKRTGSNHVYLDVTSRSKSFLSGRFPTIYKRCQEHGILMDRDQIPVIPVQHYFMGGIKTNRFAESSIHGLYASGECACTGVHGANRLASNSLLECLVFASQCADHINRHPLGEIELNIDPPEKTEHPTEDFSAIKRSIKGIMQVQGGIVKNEKGLSIAIDKIDHILKRLEGKRLLPVMQVEVYNMAIVAREILVASKKRKVNLGSHFKEGH